MVVLTASRELKMLAVRVVLNLLIQCSDTTIAGYLTSIVAEIHPYPDFEAHYLLRMASTSAK